MRNGLVFDEQVLGLGICVLTQFMVNILLQQLLLHLQREKYLQNTRFSSCSFAELHTPIGLTLDRQKDRRTDRSQAMSNGPSILLQGCIKRLLHLQPHEPSTKFIIQLQLPFPIGNLSCLLMLGWSSGSAQMSRNLHGCWCRCAPAITPAPWVVY